MKRQTHESGCNLLTIKVVNETQMEAASNSIIIINMIPMHGMRRITHADCPEALSEKGMSPYCDGTLGNWYRIRYLPK